MSHQIEHDRLEPTDPATLAGDALQRILDRRIAAGQFEFIGEGRVGRVIDVSAGLDATRDTAAAWVVKEKKQSHALEHGLVSEAGHAEAAAEEFRLQQTAYRLLERARSTTDGPLPRVPQPLSLLANGKKQFLLMEKISGATLLEHVAKQWLAYYMSDGLNSIDDADPTAGPLSHWPQEKILETIFSDTYVYLLPPRIIDEYNRGNATSALQLFRALLIHGENTMVSADHPEPILTDTQYAKINNGIAALNKSGFYHRDLKPDNLMIDDSGEVYIIDFDKSIYQPERVRTGTAQVGSVYQEDTLVSSTAYIRDNEITDILERAHQARVARLRRVA